MTVQVRRPWTVALGCALSLGISLWDIATTVSDEEIIDSRTLLSLLLMLSMIVVISALAAFFRQNWGRIVVAVLTGLSVASLPLFGLLGEDMAVPLDTEILLYAFADLLVILLLFLPASNNWFCKSHAKPG